MAPVISPLLSESSATGLASNTSAPNPTRRRLMARPSASSRLPCASGLTPRPTCTRGREPTICQSGYTATIGTGHTALFVHKILQSAKPSDMPVEQPTKFELVLNFKIAKALGIDVPLFFQQRA